MSPDRDEPDTVLDEDEPLIPAPTWARLLLAVAPFLIGGLVVLVVRWLT